MVRYLLFLAFLFFAGLANASDVIGLKITAFGIEGAYRQQQGVVLLRVGARNNSAQPRTATIRVYQANMNAFARPAWFSYAQTVTLPPGDARVLDVPLRLANAQNSILYAEAIDGAGIPLGHAAQIIGHPTEGKLIGLICASDEVCKTVREKILFSGTAEEQTRKAQDLRLIQMRQIPPHWWAYAPMDTIVLAAPTSGFQHEELDGLEAFVLQGGRLVLAEKEIGNSASSWPSFAGTPTPGTKATLTPFGSGTLVKVPSVDGTEFSNFFRPYGFAASTPRDLVKQFELYRELVFAQPQADIVSWLQARTATHFRFPGPLKLILWMTAYLILMIVVSFLLPRRFGKPELAWLIIPALAILFSAILYKVSAQNRPTQYRLEESRYYQLDGNDTLAIAMSELQVSSPHKGAIRLAVPGEFVFKPPLTYAGYGPTDSFEPGLEGVSGGEIALGESWETNIFLRVWSSKSLSFEFTRRFPGSVSQSDHSHLVNSTGVDFEEAMVVTKDTVYLLGTFPAGATVDLGKARQIAYREAAGHKGEILRTPPFAFDRSKQQESDEEAAAEESVETLSDATSLVNLVRGWPRDGDRVFSQTKAVFFGKGKDVTRAAQLESVAAQQKSTALYGVTYRDWK